MAGNQSQSQNIPEGNTLISPFPKSPDLFDEVEWGSFPTADDVERAYLLWSTQDRSLALSISETRDPAPGTGVTGAAHSPMYCLVENVYRKLMENSLLPLAVEQYDARAQYRRDSISGSTKRWTYEELFGREPASEAAEAPVPFERRHQTISINGHDILKGKYWVKPKLQTELRSRGIDPNGTVAVLRNRLYDDEVRQQNIPVPSPEKDKGSLLHREDLTPWGIPRSDDYMLKITTGHELSPLDLYTWAILLSPYNPAYWTSRAFLHYQMGYHDLAIGDAYRAQLLCGVLVTPSKRNAQPGLYVRIWDAIERHILQTPRVGGRLSDEVQILRKNGGVNSFIPAVQVAIHHIITLSLLGLQCWHDYQDTERVSRTRLAISDGDAAPIIAREEGLKEFVSSALKSKQQNDGEYLYERRYGCAPGRPYPYGPKGNERLGTEFVEKINNDILGVSQAINLHSEKIEVRIDPETDELGVWATEDIPQGELVYVDEPSIRGHLRTGRLHDDNNYCENCKRSVPPRAFQGEMLILGDVDICACTKLENDAITWCGPQPQLEDEDSDGSSKTNERMKGKNKRIRAQAGGGPDNDHPESSEHPNKRQKARTISCLDIARSAYHHRVCGKNWTWLHDAMRQVFVNDGHREPHLAHTNERHGTVLSLLLREVFDITLNRREVEAKPNLLAHEIDELMPLIGAENMTGHNFPFSFAANIKIPFDILSCLGVNIFRDLTFDTWVIQLVLRKLLLNAIPWDHSRRFNDKGDGTEKKQLKEGSLAHLSQAEFPKADPTFKDLYIFPGVAMFNHSCQPYHNVTWDWDKAIPNRLVLWAKRPIQKDEELFLQYSSSPFNTFLSKKILGYPCYCQRCEYRADTPSSPQQSDIYGSDASSSAPDQDHGQEQDDRQAPLPETDEQAAESNASHSRNARELAPDLEEQDQRLQSQQNFPEAIPTTVASIGTASTPVPVVTPVSSPAPVPAAAPTKNRTEVEKDAGADTQAPDPRRRGPRIRYKGKIMSRDEGMNRLRQEKGETGTSASSGDSE